MRWQKLLSRSPLAGPEALPGRPCQGGPAKIVVTRRSQATEYLIIRGKSSPSFYIAYVQLNITQLLTDS